MVKLANSQLRRLACLYWRRVKIITEIINIAGSAVVHVHETASAEPQKGRIAMNNAAINNARVFQHNVVATSASISFRRRYD